MTKAIGVAVAALLLTSCAESPTTPSPPRLATSTPLVAERIQAPTRNTSTLGPALGTATATNHELTPGWFVRIIFRLASDGQQYEVASTAQDAAPGQTVDLSVGVAQDPCESYQDDVFWLLPRAAHYTLSDTMNYRAIVSRVVAAVAHCRNAPTTPLPAPSPPPPDPPSPPVGSPPPPLPPSDPCVAITVRPFDPFVARTVYVDVAESGVLGFTLTAGGVVYDHFDKLPMIAGVVTMRAPGGYFHETHGCVDGVVVIALVGTGK